MVTLEIENDKIREKPKSNTVSKNKNSGKIRHTTPENDFEEVEYLSLYSVFQTVGILLILSVFCWLQFYRGGYGFVGNSKICNWHPLLMTISCTYLFANSILHFRNFRRNEKQELKKQHAIIHISIIVIGSLGVWAGINSNEIAQPPVPKFYSIHSWLGILTIVIFLSQFICGFMSFLYPEISTEYKAAILPYHAFFGVLNFVLSVVTSLLGFSEKIMFALNLQHQYMPIEGVFLNFLGIILFIYGVLVVYIVMNPKYKRSPKL